MNCCKRSCGTAWGWEYARQKTTGWRRGWDSNPRDPFGPNGFQDRRSQPLSYPSAIDSNIDRLEAVVTAVHEVTAPHHRFLAWIVRIPLYAIVAQRVGGFVHGS